MAAEKMYGPLADWFHLITHPNDYEEEASIFSNIFLEEKAEVSTLLELGSGGGNNASHMKQHFEMTLVDRSKAMLNVSKKLNPKCKHFEGDMCSVRLNKTYDGVFIHDAISYLKTEDELRAALETAFVHCRPGGRAVFVPDHTKETFKESTSHGGHDGKERSLRYLEWTIYKDSSHSSYLCHFAYLMRKENGSVNIEHDQHELGLFSRDRWLALISEVGFEAQTRPFEHSELESASCEIFLGLKPQQELPFIGSTAL